MSFGRPTGNQRNGRTRIALTLGAFLLLSGAGYYNMSYVVFHTTLYPILLEDTGGGGSSPYRNVHVAPQEDYQLAYKQSFGFFHDVPSDHWKIAQTIHNKLFPNHLWDNVGRRYVSGIHAKGKPDELKRAKDWYAENFQVEFHCPLAQRIPTDSNGDGPKWVCDPHRIAQQDDCLVYSVGSNGNVQFEKAIKKEISQQCEIHTFDPVIYNPRYGDFEKALEGYATFHAWGLGVAPIRHPNNTKTLEQTVDTLGHTNRTIDIFKIDCEWCEWWTYKDWIANGNIRQILVETHNAPMPNVRDFFYHLHDAGYVIFSKEANYNNGAGGVEYAFLKLRPDFFVNGSTYLEHPELHNGVPGKFTKYTP